jgi:hypothetical protein
LSDTEIIQNFQPHALDGRRRFYLAFLIGRSKSNNCYAFLRFFAVHSFHTPAPPQNAGCNTSVHPSRPRSNYCSGFNRSRCVTLAPNPAWKSVSLTHILCRCRQACAPLHVSLDDNNCTEVATPHAGFNVVDCAQLWGAGGEQGMTLSRPLRALLLAERTEGPSKKRARRELRGWQHLASQPSSSRRSESCQQTHAPQQTARLFDHLFSAGA